MSFTHQIPYRLTEKCFHKYEDVIASAVHYFPDISWFNHISYGLPPSLETVTARMRDAMTSLAKYNWATTKVDMVKFRECWNHLIVTQHNGLLLCGSLPNVRAAKSEPESKVLSTKEGFSPSNAEWLDLRDVTDPVAMVGIFTLAVYQAINRPVLLTLAPDAVTKIESKFDIALQPQPDGSYLLLP